MNKKAKTDAAVAAKEPQGFVEWRRFGQFTNEQVASLATTTFGSMFWHDIGPRTRLECLSQLAAELSAARAKIVALEEKLAKVPKRRRR